MQPCPSSQGPLTHPPYWASLHPSCATALPCGAEFVTTQGCLVSYSSQATSRPKADSAMYMLSSSLQCQVPTCLYIKGPYLSFLSHYIFFSILRLLLMEDISILQKRRLNLESVGAQLGESEAGCLQENVLSLCVFYHCCGQILGQNHLQEREGLFGSLSQTFLSIVVRRIWWSLHDMVDRFNRMSLPSSIFDFYLHVWGSFFLTVLPR